jgi:hypothetical protein
VSTFFGGCGKLSAVFFYRVFELPLLRNAQKRDKKKPSKTTEVEKTKTEGEKATFFVMSPDGFFGKKKVLSCF